MVIMRPRVTLGSHESINHRQSFPFPELSWLSRWAVLQRAWGGWTLREIHLASSPKMCQGGLTSARRACGPADADSTSAVIAVAGRPSRGGW